MRDAALEDQSAFHLSILPSWPPFSQRLYQEWRIALHSRMSRIPLVLALSKIVKLAMRLCHDDDLV
jgi:hypothetical protein